MRKIKILHMTPPIINNGIYKYIFSNLKYINKDKFQFDFMTQNRQDLMNTEEYQKYQFGIRSFSTTQRDNINLFQHQIRDILSDGYDVVQLHTSYWRGFVIEEIAMKLGIPKVIVHSHSTWIDKVNEDERKELLKIHENFKNIFDERYATHFWACSKKAGKWLFNNRICSNKLQIMPNAIELDRFAFNEIKRSEVRRKWNLDGAFVIGHTGRFEYQKNHEFLIRMFAKVYEKYSGSRLLLVGEGILMPEMKNLVQELRLNEVVIFTGWKDNIEELLQAMDVYCLPSRFEGLPISLIEAQTSGLRCFASSSITNEVKITDNVQFLDLEEALWEDEILKLAVGYSRQDETMQISEAGYDIRKQVEFLEKIYEN